MLNLSMSHVCIPESVSNVPCLPFTLRCIVGMHLCTMFVRTINK